MSHSNLSSSQITVIHGPNLNMLGYREPDIYGKMTLEDINMTLKQIADDLHISVDFFQSNHEGELVDRIQQAIGKSRGLIINPGGYTHTSVSIRDALAMYPAPIIEVHLSNIYKRETFRSKSMISPVVTATLSGFGAEGYKLALLWFANKQQA